MTATTTLIIALLISAIVVVDCAPLSKVPHLRCSACLVIGEFVGHKMNESAKLRSSFQASHRLDAQNKIKRVDYEASELRAVEILDKFCENLQNEYVLRYDPELDRRLYSNNKTLKHADLYGKTDKQLLRAHKKRLRDICYDITEERDDILVGMIKKLRKLDELQHELCYVSLEMCSTTQEKENQAITEERVLRAEWVKFNDAKQKKEEERRMKREQDREKEREKEREDKMRRDMDERMKKDMEERMQKDMDERLQKTMEGLVPPPAIPSASVVLDPEAEERLNGEEGTASVGDGSAAAGSEEL